MNRRISGFSPEAMAALVAYPWPGNVRELQNAIERAVVLCNGDRIEAGHFPFVAPPGAGRSLARRGRGGPHPPGPRRVLAQRRPGGARARHRPRHALQQDEEVRHRAAVKVRLLGLGEVPPRLAEAVLAGLPRPFAGGEIGRLSVSIERCYDRTRAQVDAACLIEQVPDPEPGWSVLGLTGVDLFMPALTYVFGISHLGGRRGIVSWFRLHPEEETADAQAHSHPAYHHRGRPRARPRPRASSTASCPTARCTARCGPRGSTSRHPEYCPACLATLASL